MRNAKPYHSKIYHSCHSDTLRHSEGCKPEESTLLCHSERSEESHPACHSERSEESKNVESQDTESKKESESTKDKYDFQR